MRQYRRGDVIGRVQGRIVRDPDYESDYCIDLGDGTSLEPGLPWRLLNHHCQPNCEIVAWEGENNGQLWLMARRLIRPDHELTIDYAWPAEVAIPCRCGAQSCRGWIVDARQLPRLTW